jgi:pyrroline-5-carboxylate reductase
MVVPRAGEIAFLGSGSMAAAMVDGLLARKTLAPGAMACIGGSGTSARRLAERTGIRLAGGLEDLLGTADTLVVAFKPQHLADADPRLARLTEGRLVISVLAGKTIGALSRAFPAARNIVRSMPNTPSRIGAGVTGWCARSELTAADRAVIDSIFGALGRSIELPESKMDAFTAICGCGPAYVFEFAAALRDCALQLGFDAQASKMFAVETLCGAARLLAEQGVDPEVLRGEVTSPNGVTAAALRKMADLGFRDMMRDALRAAEARSRELSL